MTYAPIIIMVYDRLEHFKNLIISLKEDPLSSNSDLYVMSDAAYKDGHECIINEVREFARTITGFKSYTLFENKSNKGSNMSYQLIVKKVFEKHDKVIYFEDDNLVTPNYLKFMNDAFDKYENEPSVVFVCGYNFPIDIPQNYKYDVYFYPSVCAWGYGMWKSKYLDVYALDKNDMINDKKTIDKIKKSSDQLYFILNTDLYSDRILNDARIGYLMNKNNYVSIFPKFSLVQNTGHDGSGLNCSKNDFYQNQVKYDEFTPKNFPDKVFINEGIKREMIKYSTADFKTKLKAQVKLIYIRAQHLFN